MLTNRQLLILQVTVDDFIQSAQPVGSRQLSKKEEVPFSPATIRNEMADLEELGFLEKTHTSSGRIPSQKGYRYYVDHFLSPTSVPKSDIQQIQSIFEERLLEAEHIIQRTALILSELTSYTTILLGPDMKKYRVKKFSIVPLSGQSAVAIIILDTGHVENRLVEIPQGIDASDLEKMVNILNEQLTGVHLHELQHVLEREALSLMKKHIGRYAELYQSLSTTLVSPNEEKVYYGGKTNLLQYPEFHDLQKATGLFTFMDQLPQITSMFSDTEKGMQIRIGTENNLQGMEDISVVSAKYSIGEEQQGTIAIIGPTRMDYKRAVSILDFMSGDLSRELTKLFKGLNG
ncbi:heat-inducible transcriptional repressor HrcA [Paenisporosarcina cavernae]|uniref:Heat-inducible transcription repressor HrcA n=1 Tax=Paenisporosarcina cavernae TaxID=2320858 RepID=A0A385YS86_9BACL|nr:heat-inducible transcriptional repressor HrcA [Paenisporosarcina cavernae]AYC29629.1 heat-inducible transcriptional repressor HrcA [Paenisporosarcina cavernae]